MKTEVGGRIGGLWGERKLGNVLPLAIGNVNED